MHLLIAMPEVKMIQVVTAGLTDGQATNCFFLVQKLSSTQYFLGYQELNEKSHVGLRVGVNELYGFQVAVKAAVQLQHSYEDEAIRGSFLYSGVCNGYGFTVTSDVLNIVGRQKQNFTGQRSKAAGWLTAIMAYEQVESFLVGASFQVLPGVSVIKTGEDEVLFHVYDSKLRLSIELCSVIDKLLDGMWFEDDEYDDILMGREVDDDEDDETLPT
jgi:hypothetical protein